MTTTFDSMGNRITLHEPPSPETSNLSAALRHAFIQGFTQARVTATSTTSDVNAALASAERRYAHYTPSKDARDVNSALKRELTPAMRDMLTGHGGRAYQIVRRWHLGLPEDPHPTVLADLERLMIDAFKAAMRAGQ